MNIAAVERGRNVADAREETPIAAGASRKERTGGVGSRNRWAVLGLVALDGDLDAGDTSELNWSLLDVGSHRHLGHEFAERRPQCRDICVGVEPALAKDGVQLALLFFAHHHRIAVTQVSRPRRMMVICDATDARR